MGLVVRVNRRRQVRVKKPVVLYERGLDFSEALLGLNLQCFFDRIADHQRAGQHRPGHDGAEQRARMRARVMREAVENEPRAGH